MTADPGEPRLRRRGRRLRVRRVGRRAAADREGLPGRWCSRPAAGSPTTSSPGPRGTCAASCGRRGWAASASSGSTCCRTSPILAGAGRRRRLAGLRQHPLPARRRVLRRPAVARHHRLARRAGARTTTRPSGCSASSHNPTVTPRDEAMQAVAEQMGVGAHLPAHPGRRVLRRRPGRDGARPVLRRRRAGAHRLPRVRRVHDRLPARREEHPAEELPVPGRAAGARGAAADDGDRAPAAGRRRLRGRHGADRRVAARRTRATVTAGQVVLAAGASAPSGCCTGCATTGAPAAPVAAARAS